MSEGKQEAREQIDENYVVWLRSYKNGPIQTCDSDAPGAFRAYRESYLKRAKREWFTKGLLEGVRHTNAIENERDRLQLELNALKSQPQEKAQPESDDEWPPCCQEAHDFGLQAGRLEAKSEIDAAFQRGQQAMAEKAAQVAEDYPMAVHGHKKGGGSDCLTGKHIAAAIRSLASAEPPQQDADELCWRILGEWYYECSVEKIKQASVDSNNENAFAIREEFEELKRIVAGKPPQGEAEKEGQQ